MERNSRYELIKLLSFEDVLASSGKKHWILPKFQWQ